MPKTRVVLNHKVVQEYLDGKYGVDQLMDEEAAKVLSRAKSSAPVVSGDYKDSLHVVTDHTDRTRRAIVAGVDYGYAVEANHGTLAKALDAAR